MAEGHPRLHNDRGVPEIRIGVREFECIGASPPHDHPHIYIEMGSDETILCLYCATFFHFDATLGPDETYPYDCLYSSNHRRSS